MQEARLAGRLHLLAQITHEDIDRVAVDLPRVAPHLREQLRAREHLADVFGERQEQVELTRRQSKVAARTRHDPTPRVDREVSDDQRAVRPLIVEAHERVEPRRKLRIENGFTT